MEFELTGKMRVGLGTHLGGYDDATDTIVERALRDAIEGGIRVIDTALIYRCQRAERCIGKVLQNALKNKNFDPDQIFISTKIGLLPAEIQDPSEIDQWIEDKIVRPGLAMPDQIVPPTYQCFAPAWLEWSVNQSRRNLGLQCMDLVFLHCPEFQRDSGRPYRLALESIRIAFDTLEKMRSAGLIKAYGVATWSAFRVQESHEHYLSIEDSFCARSGNRWARSWFSVSPSALESQ